jgi:dienelactone hydrolase
MTFIETQAVNHVAPERRDPSSPVDIGAAGVRPHWDHRKAVGLVAARANRLFTAAIGVVALHIADDSFLQPQPGTSAGDHLASGLVPLALLALAGVAYPRLRAGGQAVVALVIGFLGIGFGSEAVRYWSDIGLSGDDYTGLASILAGVTLIGLGAVTLWRSRRLDDHRAWRYPRRALLGVAGLLVLLEILFPIAVGYGTTHIARSDKNTGTLDLPHVDVTLRTSDDLDLPGWYVPAKNGAAVIVFPGRANHQKYARMLARHGYGVLLFDRRGEGKADGDPEGFGWNLDKDVKAAIAYLKTRPDVERGRIGGLGLSVGGEMLLDTAAETKDLAAVVSEGAGARVMSEEMADLSGPAKLTSAPLLAVKTAAVALFSDTLPPANLETLIPRISPRPVFLINALHNEVDHKAPEYFAAAKEPKQQWLVPKGGHTGGITAMPEEYERRVVGFLDRSLLGRPGAR